MVVFVQVMGKAVARAVYAGFRVIVWDEKKSFQPWSIPWGKTVAPPEKALQEGVRLHGSSYVVVATRITRWMLAAGGRTHGLPRNDRVRKKIAHEKYF